MLDGRQRADWQHTAALNFYNVNAHRDPKSPVVPFDTFNPMAARKHKPKQQQGEDAQASDWKVARKMWERACKQKGRGGR
jgi:hypothetical protein